MAISTIPTKDGTGTTQNVAYSDQLGGTDRLPVTAPVVGAAVVSGTNPLPVTGRILRPASNGVQILSRSGAPYAAGDLIADNATAGSIVPFSWDVGRSTGFIRRVMLTSNRNTAPSGTPILRMHFWTAAPTFTNADNGAFLASGLAAGAATYLGAFDFASPRAFSNGYAWLAGYPLDGSEQNFVIPSGTTLYGALTVSPNSPSTYVPYDATAYETFYAYPEIHLF